MSEKPLILVTNDDGITAPGIRSLIKIIIPGIIKAEVGLNTMPRLKMRPVNKKLYFLF